MEKKNLGTYLDNLIDADGFKTDLTVSIPPENMRTLCLYLLGTVAAGSLVYFSIRTIFLKSFSQ